MGRIVVAERCLVDSIVSIAYALNDPEFDSKLVAKAILHLIPRERVPNHKNKPSNQTQMTQEKQDPCPS